MRRIVLALSIGTLLGVALYRAERIAMAPSSSPPMCVYFTPNGIVEAPCR